MKIKIKNLSLPEEAIKIKMKIKIKNLSLLKSIDEVETGNGRAMRVYLQWLQSNFSF